ncbi:hypothetical protein HHK36_019834 [Tetracentron sinense]|uniref:Glycosyltransferase n=1 Tax=Tetracentron sinense TaxID=13715 RepID=A0A834YUG6_TETSI|nr:hypothetical protein HHK36_019834 [Tetracentron sinense]
MGPRKFREGERKSSNSTDGAFDVMPVAGAGVGGGLVELELELAMAQREEKNVVIFPFMAQGHLIPFLALAFQIEQRKGYTVTLVNTPLNIKKLRSSLPPNTTIRLAELPFCSADHGLPPHSENTDVLPHPLIIRLLESTISLKPSFKSLISDLTLNQNLLCIIADMFFGWTVDIAYEFGVFHSFFISAGAYGTAIFFSLLLHLPQHETDSDDEFSLPDFPQVSRIHSSQLPYYLKNTDGDSNSWSIFLKREFLQWLNSDGLLVNTVEDLDQPGLQYFRRTTNRPVWSIGPTLSSMARPLPSKEAAGISPDFCLEWLDNHPPASVIYVSFGSQNRVSASQMMELAMALDASGKNFIWVVRPPVGFDIGSEFRAGEWLPEGFEGRMKDCNRGLLVRKWAPQLEILAHKSTGAFVSHCGWNSVLESLSHGVPIIGWPMAAEQFFNAKLLEEEIGVCVEVARGNECEVRHEEIARVIELVMNGGDKGEEMRRKACEVKEIIKDSIRDDDEGFKGSSVKAMDDFFDEALSMKKTKERENQNKIP